jgi:hypothetical protein
METTTTRAACFAAIGASLLATEPKHFKENAWGRRHCSAWSDPRGPEMPIRLMFQVLAGYADAHAIRFESPLAEDGILGQAWLDMLRGLRTLLNGDLGRFDGGTLDALAHAIADAAGFEPEAVSL